MSSHLESGRAYLLTGQGMKAIERTGLPLGQVVSYGDMANARHEAVVIETTGGPHGQECIFRDTLHLSHVSKTVIDGPGGWKQKEEVATGEEIAALKVKRTEKQKAEAEESARRAKEQEEAIAAGMPLIPAGVKAAIVAELNQDNSDLMTDYHNHTTSKVVILGWSTHTKDLFAEMRQAAATFPETAHLGPGKDLWKILVYYSPDEGPDRYRESRYLWDVAFTTEAEAKAYAEAAIAESEDELRREGSTSPRIPYGEYRLDKSAVEHREKYSMGAGYYLKAGSNDSDGWRVRKWDISYNRQAVASLLGRGHVGPALLDSAGKKLK